MVASKVHFTNSREELEEFIPPDHIIAELGGSESWHYTYPEPTELENTKMADTETRQRFLDSRVLDVNEFEKLTHEWIAEIQETEALKQRNEIAEKLRTGYWQLDPYVRARTLYDRAGIIGHDGTIRFYPTQSNGVAATSGVASEIAPPAASEPAGTLSEVSTNRTPTPAINGSTGTKDVQPLVHIPDELD